MRTAETWTGTIYMHGKTVIAWASLIHSVRDLNCKYTTGVKSFKKCLKECIIAWECAFIFIRITPSPIFTPYLGSWKRSGSKYKRCKYTMIFPTRKNVFKQIQINQPKGKSYTDIYVNTQQLLLNTTLFYTWRHVSAAHTAIFRPAYNRTGPFIVLL